MRCGQPRNSWCELGWGMAMLAALAMAALDDGAGWPLRRLGLLPKREYWPLLAARACVYKSSSV